MSFWQKTPPKEGKSVPDFQLSSLEGKPFTLTAQRGQPTALFFFCGCAACWEVAKEWTNLQRSGVLTQPAVRLQKTVVIYVDLSLKAAQDLAEAMAWDKPRTILLLDKDNTLRDRFQAEPCPRVFIADDRLILRYTNTHSYDAPQKAPAAAIVAFTLDALKKLPPPTPKARKGPA